MPDHVIADGEYLSALAEQYGFRTYKTIWEHPKNAELASKRKNPNVLLPGDVVFIPEKQVREVKAMPDASHRFVLTRDRLRLRLKIGSRFDLAPSLEEATVIVDGDESVVQVQDGAIDVEIPRTARSGKVFFGDQEIPFVLGTLDPVDELSGIRQRLANLGFDAGELLPPIDESADPDLAKRVRLAEEQLRWAIEEAQLAASRAPNGKADASLHSLLEELHGM